jgi:hypothetical protein
MKKILLLLTIIMALFGIACKKNASGPPVITNVRTVDTTTRDSSFTKAVPGTLIVIQGSNLGGLLAVYFNDTSAYFNPVYATSTNIIVTIPSSAQTAATNPNVPSTIKLVTDHGTTSYSFTLYLHPPVINSLSFDNSGTIVYINGANFAGVKKITFPITGGGADTALGFTVNKAFTQITAQIPPGTPYQDSLRVYCTFGTGAFSYPPPMTITMVSNENGVGGTTITLTGTNFVGVNKVLFPGNLPGTNLTVNNVNSLTVTVPSGITAPDSLRISGVLGTASSPQLFDSYITYTSPGYLSTFEQQWAGDNTAFVGWTGGYASAAAASAKYPNGTGGVGVLLQGSPMSANAGPTSQGNAGMLQLNDVPWIGNTGLPISNYSLKFEVYVDTAVWSAGSIWIAVGDWYGWSSYTARYAPWESAPGGKYQQSGWQTVTIPLTQFIQGNQFWKTSWTTGGSPATHFSDYPTTGIAFLIANDQAQSVPANSVNIAIDNVRIVQGQ